MVKSWASTCTYVCPETTVMSWTDCVVRIFRHKQRNVCGQQIVCASLGKSKMSMLRNGSQRHGYLADKTRWLIACARSVWMTMAAPDIPSSPLDGCMRTVEVLRVCGFLLMVGAANLSVLLRQFYKLNTWGSGEWCSASLFILDREAVVKPSG